MSKSYPFIRAWGRYTGSYQYYIDAQVALARAEYAPEDALYKAAISGEWVCMGDVTSKQAIESIRFILNQEGVIS